MKHQAVLAVAASAVTQDWDAAYHKAASAMERLSISEKVGIVTGVGWHNGPCVGNTSPVPSIGYPSLCLHDGPLGIRFATGATAFPPAIHAASTWNVSLIRQRGAFIAQEAKGLGVHNSLGPCMGPLGKIPQGGRNWEGFGPDPYLAGIGAAHTVRGMQEEGVQATAKHWLFNEQEEERTTISTDVKDGRAVRELYAWPFADTVHAGVAAVMCSYNKINGTWACENEDVLDGLLKGEMGFRGYIMTDWNAQHSTGKSAHAGLDMAMPGDDYHGGHIYWGPQLEAAVEKGDVSEERVDDMVMRVLAAWYLTGQDDPDFPTVDLQREVQTEEHRQNARDIARDGMVLLKNEGGVLPLKKGQKEGQGVLGSSSGSSIAVIGSGAVKGKHAKNECQDHGCDDGALGMGWGSGSVPYPYFVAPWDAIKQRADAEGLHATLSGTDDAHAARNAARSHDISLVFITADSGEGYIDVEGSSGDRLSLDPWHDGNALVAAAAAASDNVVVVVNSVGPVVLEEILAHDAVTAVVWAGLPSQEYGNALVDVLWDVSPSGKMVYTIAKSEEDYGTGIRHGHDAFEEGMLVDYRGFDARDISPRYEFGFGLSYTEFAYSKLGIKSWATPGPATGPIVSGGPEDLFDHVATITVDVKNVGPVPGAEVPQLYLAYPDSVPGTPPKQLRGFDKLRLDKGQTRTATFRLRRRDLSYWDDEHGWVVPEGEFGVLVGASSRDVRLEGRLRVSKGVVVEAPLGDEL